MTVKTTPVINTARLCLHAFSEEDAESMIALLTNSEVIKTYMVPDFKSHSEEVRMFKRFQELSDSNEHFVYGVYLEEKLIGFINDVEIKLPSNEKKDDGRAEIELGYVIDPSYKNQGFATEVLAAAIKELFAAGFSVVRTDAFEENTASMRVMEKCGMVRLEQQEEIKYRGKLHRCFLYEIRK